MDPLKTVIYWLLLAVGGRPLAASSYLGQRLVCAACFAPLIVGWVPGQSAPLVRGSKAASTVKCFGRVKDKLLQ